jgi:hypothetical protein
MERLTSNSPYSLENFKWLMEHSSATRYLSDDSLNKIETALKGGEEAILRDLYPIILPQFIAERDIDVDFIVSQEDTMNSFVTAVEKIGLGVTEQFKESKQQYEEKEKLEAENILNELV